MTTKQTHEDKDKEIAALNARVEELEGELGRVSKNHRRALAEKRKLKAKAKSERPRKFDVKIERGKPKDLFALLSGDVHDIVLCTGKGYEIRTFTPIEVSPDLWRVTSRGVLMQEAIEVKGGARPLSIGGIAAVDPDGQQVAWAELREPIAVAEGQQVRVPSITF